MTDIIGVSRLFSLPLMDIAKYCLGDSILVNSLCWGKSKLLKKANQEGVYLISISRSPEKSILFECINKDTKFRIVFNEDNAVNRVIYSFDKQPFSHTYYPSTQNTSIAKILEECRI